MIFLCNPHNIVCFFINFDSMWIKCAFGSHNHNFIRLKIIGKELDGIVEDDILF